MMTGGRFPITERSHPNLPWHSPIPHRHAHAAGHDDQHRMSVIQITVVTVKQRQPRKCRFEVNHEVRMKLLRIQPKLVSTLRGDRTRNYTFQLAKGGCHENGRLAPGKRMSDNLGLNCIPPHSAGARYTATNDYHVHI